MVTWEDRSRRIIAAGVAALTMAAGVLPSGAALAQHSSKAKSRQNTKNNMRNLGIGLGAASVYELFKGQTTAGVILGAGAAYAAKKYEDTRKEQSQKNRDRNRRNYRQYRSRAGSPRVWNRDDDPAAPPAAALPATGRYGRPVAVMVDDKPAAFLPNRGAEIIGGCTYVPLRGVLDRMGANVSFDQPRKTVVIVHRDKTVRLPANDLASINGKRFKLDPPAFILNGETMVPLRFLSETFGAKVAWEPSGRVVRVQSPSSSAASASVR